MTPPVRVGVVGLGYGGPNLARNFDALPGVHELERRGAVVRLTLEGSADRLVKALAGFEVEALDSHEADLEDVFLELYRRPANAR